MARNGFPWLAHFLGTSTATMCVKIVFSLSIFFLAYQFISRLINAQFT
jgi:hypothetical protein